MIDVAFDLETWRIQPGRLAPRIVCMSWNDGSSGGVLHRDAPDDRTIGALDYFETLLNAPDVRLIGHNVSFDIGVVVNERPRLIESVFGAYDAGRIVDTMVRQKLRKIAQGFDKWDPEMGLTAKGKMQPPMYHLTDIVKEFFGETIEGKHGPDAWRLRYHELDAVPVALWPAEARDYSYLDSEYTLRVWQKLLDLGDTEPEGAGSADLEAQCRHAWWMHLMAAWGVRSDPYAAAVLKAEVSETVERAMPRLVQAGIFTSVGKRKDKVVREMTAKAYACKGLEAPRTDPSTKFANGQVQISKEVLAESGDDMLILASEIASEKSILTGAVPLLEKAQNRAFNPRWNSLVATGRTSCGSDDDPGNLQNQRRRGGVRESWVPRAGWIYLDADYHIAEMCALAQVLLDMYGKSAMADAILAGRDLHLEMAAVLMGISYEEVERRYEAKDPEAKNKRQLSKPINFGFPGGLGPETFVQTAKDGFGVIITLDEAANYKQIWLGRFPEMRYYFRDMSKAVSHGPTKIVHPRSGRIRGGVTYNAACNSYFQGLVADGAKAAGYEIARECYAVPSSPLYGCRITAFVHDEFILEAPIPQARAAAKRLSEIMIEQMQRFTPDIPAKADTGLMRRWYKEVEPTYICPVCKSTGTSEICRKVVAEPEVRCGTPTLLIPWEPAHPGKAFAKALKDKGLTAEAFAEATRLPLGEVLAVKGCEMGMSGAWYDGLVGVFGGKAEDWRAKQRQWGLEQRAKARDEAMGFGRVWAVG
jgi:hypothetical protein